MGLEKSGASPSPGWAIPARNLTSWRTMSLYVCGDGELMTARWRSTASLTGSLAGGSVGGRSRRRRRRSSALRRCRRRCCAGRGRRCRGRRLRQWIEPAGVDPGVQSLRRLRVDAALPNDTTECRLNVAARAAKPVVEIEMAEGRVHIVAPHQADHSPPKPDAFRIAGGPAELFCRFGELFDLALRLFSAIGRLRRRLVAALGVAALGHRVLGTEYRRRRENRGEAQTQKGGHGRAGCCLILIISRRCVALLVHGLGPICG